MISDRSDGYKAWVDELLSRCADPGFTPGERDVAPLLAQWATARGKVGGKALDQTVAKALGRGGAKVLDGLLDGLTARESAEQVVRLRAVGRMLGRSADIVDAPRVEALVTALEAGLVGEPVVVREVARVLAKLEDELAAPFEPLLIAVVQDGDAPQRRAAIEALGRIGGAAALQFLASDEHGAEDDDLRRRRGEAVALLERRAERATSGHIVVDRALRAATTVRLRCRAGLAPIVAEQVVAVAPIEAKVSATDVELAWSGSLGELHRVRSALDIVLRFPLPTAASPVHRVVNGLSDPAVVAALTAWTDGRVRFRLTWVGQGHRRADTWLVARTVSQSDLPLVNDSREALWTIEVDEARGHLDCRPAFDPRFACRRADVPAASHPTVAAALAWVAAPEPGMTVWDPFCGSGQELVECARRTDGLRLLGSDLEPDALAAATDNLAAAEVAAEVALHRADATTFAPPRPVDRIVTNPPMGRRVAGGQDLEALLQRVLEHAVDCLAPGATITWLSPRPAATAAMARSLGLQVDDRAAVDMGGFTAGLQVLRAR